MKPGQGGSPYYTYRIKPRGVELLALLQAYRDIWELIELRDLRRLAAAVELMERLERERRALFPGPGPEARPFSYWAHDRRVKIS